MVETNHSIKYDKKLGDVIIDGVKYDTLDLTASSEKKDNKLFMTIVTKEGETYLFESKERSFLMGYGDIGRNIKKFNKMLPILQKTSELQHLKAKIRSGYIPVISPPSGVLLKRGEYAVITNNNVKYCQERTRTEHHSVGASFRVTKGIKVGVGKSNPVTKEGFAVLDYGVLTLTNKRLIFVGDRKSTTIPISKISALERYRDGIDITKEGVMRQTRFVNIDGDMYADLITNVAREL